MCYHTYSLKQMSIVMAAVGILFGCCNASADDFPPAGFHKNSTHATPGQLTSNPYQRLGFSPALTIEEKNQVYLDHGYSRLRFDDNHFRLGEIDYPQKANAFKVLKLVMDEFEMLHGLRKMVEGVEARFEEYTKKMIYS
ncbi:MAG: hypothetical protein V3W19_01040 [Desulfatiglandales bacterium]